MILILAIPHDFVISNHIILLISKKNSKQILFNKKKFQINFKSETKYSPKIPGTPTRNPANWFLFPRSPRNDKLPYPDSPNPRGMEIAGELASLIVRRITQIDQLFSVQKTLCCNLVWEGIQSDEQKFLPIENEKLSDRCIESIENRASGTPQFSV